jgi:hypothetical protein
MFQLLTRQLDNIGSEKTTGAHELISRLSSFFPVLKKCTPSATVPTWNNSQQLSHSSKVKCNRGERECKNEHPLSSMHFFNCCCSWAHPLSSPRQANTEVIVEPLSVASFAMRMLLRRCRPSDPPIMTLKSSPRRRCPGALRVKAVAEPPPRQRTRLPSRCVVRWGAPQQVAAARHHPWAHPHRRPAPKLSHTCRHGVSSAEVLHGKPSLPPLSSPPLASQPHPQPAPELASACSLPWPRLWPSSSLCCPDKSKSKCKCYICWRYCRTWYA